jgi:hypothetical protein
MLGSQKETGRSMGSARRISYVMAGPTTSPTTSGHPATGDGGDDGDGRLQRSCWSPR